MEEYDAALPEYGFASNKGYGSAEHIEALKKYGPSPYSQSQLYYYILYRENEKAKALSESIT